MAPISFGPEWPATGIRPEAFFFFYSALILANYDEEWRIKYGGREGVN